MIENLKIKGNLSREKVLEYLVKNRYDLKYFKVQNCKEYSGGIELTDKKNRRIIIYYDEITKSVEVIYKDLVKTDKILKKEIIKEIKKSNKMTSEQIVEERYKKFRNITNFNVI